MFIIKVALFLPIKKTFKYLCPVDMRSKIGCRVIVPFGNRKIIGIIISTCNSKYSLPFKLKNIHSIIDESPIYTENIWNVLKQSSIYYHCSIGYILFQILPILIKQGENVLPITLEEWIVTEKGKLIDLNTLKKTPKQLYALSILRKKTILQNELKKYNLSNYVLNKLNDKGLCNIEIVCKKNLFWKKNILIKEFKLPLNKKEYLVIKQILQKEKCFMSWVLTGMNCIIKEKVYFSLILRILKKGLQILILAPNDYIVYEIVSLLQTYLDVPIDGLYDKSTNRQKFSIWIKAKNYETAIVIGTRQAVFIPIAKLGMIIVDSEHDTAYKNKKGWLYHARNLGILRARQENVPIILESVSPTLETLHNVVKKKYKYIDFCYRLFNQKKVIQHIIDINSEKLKCSLTTTIINKIYEHIHKHNHIVLIVSNCRHIFFILFCKHCKWIAKCENCNEYYYVNEHYNELFCRFCLIKLTIPMFCLLCGNTSLISRGFSIEHIKESIKNIFSNVSILCINYKNSNYKNILKKYSFKLVISKALIILVQEKDFLSIHFFNIKLAVMLLIDSHFISMKFRSIEKFAQMYTNIMYILDKKNESFEFFIQTFNPNNDDLIKLINNGYHSLSMSLLRKRSILQLPPITYHAIIYVSSKNMYSIEKFFMIFRTILNSHTQQYNNDLWTMGPFPELSKTLNKKKYIYQLLLQHSSRKLLFNILKYSLNMIKTFPIYNKVICTLDVDPI
ncbi:replication restart helicase PriA [Buchnera aphidicola]|uniref:replication restart helicase PriA n=1 Tax=Buchnera aphidicola TaxID=9 RepID=UPI0031B83164